MNKIKNVSLDKQKIDFANNLWKKKILEDKKKEEDRIKKLYEIWEEKKIELYSTPKKCLENANKINEILPFSIKENDLIKAYEFKRNKLPMPYDLAIHLKLNEEEIYNSKIFDYNYDYDRKNDIHFEQINYKDFYDFDNCSNWNIFLKSK